MHIGDAEEGRLHLGDFSGDPREPGEVNELQEGVPLEEVGQDEERNRWYAREVGGSFGEGVKEKIDVAVGRGRVGICD